MKLHALIIALFFVLSIPLSYAKVEQTQPEIEQLQPDLELVPTRGKIFHPGDDEHFNNALKTFDLVVVDFYADWCGPCRMMHKVIEDLAADRDCEDILFIKVNTDVQRNLSNRFNITSLPTIIFFVDGYQIRAIYGAHSKKEMKRIIAETFRIPKA